MRLTRQQYLFVLLYGLALAVVVIAIHEAAHIFAAMAFGAKLGELKLGFMGINPSVTLPTWLTATHRTVVYYTGGFTAGMILLMFYLLYWTRKYRRNPNFFVWLLGLATFMMAGTQFAAGYLEGRYHAAYIVGAMDALSPTNILTYGWTISTLFFHSSLCPWRRMKTLVKSAAATPHTFL